MPPPNTPEEFFEEEYRHRRSTAVASAVARRRRFTLPAHEEVFGESASEIERQAANPSAASARPSVDLSTSRSTSRSLSPPPLLRRRLSPERRGAALPDSASSSSLPSTAGRASSDDDYATNFDRHHGIGRHRSLSVVRPHSPDADSDGNRDEHNLPLSVVAGRPAFEHERTSVDQQQQQQQQSQQEQSREQEHEQADASSQAQSSLLLPPQSSYGMLRRRHSLGGDLCANTPRRRAKMRKLDWHALEYVGPYDENLDCPICRSPLVKPEITTCFHIFCHKCLVQTLEHGNRCPIDRNPIQFFETSRGRMQARSAPPVVANQLDNLVVRCPNARCDYTCARALVEHHYNVDCPFTKIACPDAACDKLVARRDSEDGSCLHKAVACVYCGKLVELAALDDHYDTDCNQKELMCEHCLAAVPRHRHGTHVANCLERRTECKYRTSGCMYTEKKKEFGDHERTCLYGMIMRLNRAHRTDMSSMETVLQDAQDRVRKLELEMATRPVAVAAAAQTPQQQQQQQQPPAAHGLSASLVGQPAFYDYVPPTPTPAPVSRPFDAYLNYCDVPDGGTSVDILQPPSPTRGKDTAHSVAQPLGGAPTLAQQTPTQQPAQPPPPPFDEVDRMNRIVAYIDIFDAKVENLERYLGEVDARQAQLFMNELGPLKDQILELRNSMGHISMYVRWLMESIRQTTKRSVGLGSAAGGSTNVSAGGGGSGVGGGGSGGSGGAGTIGGASGGGDGGVGGVGVVPQHMPPPPAYAGSVLRMGMPVPLPVRASQSPGGLAMPLRRLSDRGNPPRL